MEENRVKRQFFIDMRKKLIGHIKQVYDNSGYDLDKDKLADRLSKKLGRPVSEELVKRLLREGDDSKIDVEVWIAACTTLGINPLDILPDGCALSRSDSKDNDVWISRWPENMDTKPVPPMFYKGTYDVYYFRPLYMMENAMSGVSETENQTLVHAKLTLEPEKGTTKATLVEKEGEIGFEGDKTVRSLTLTGEAKILIKSNQVYIELKDEESLRQMVLVWPYIELAKDVLYSQVAAVLTIASQQYRHPLFEKMVMFRRDPKDPRVNESFDERIIRGILSMSSNKMLIEKSRFDDLAKEIPEIENFMKKKSTYYELSQSNIMGSYEIIDGMSYVDCMEKLMKLRNISFSPAVYTVEEHERFNIFSKMLQRGEQPIPGLNDTAEEHGGEGAQE